MATTVGGLRAQLFAVTAASGSLFVGALILFGGPTRFSSPPFATIRHLAPWWLWGSVMVACGLLAVIGATRHLTWLARVGHSVAAVAYMFFAFALADSVLKIPNGALTGLGIYSAFAVLHTLAAATADEGRAPVRRAP